MKKQLAIVISAALLTSCGTMRQLEIDSIRLSGGFAKTKATTTTTVGDNKFRESAIGDFDRGKVEIVRDTGDGIHAGLVLGASQGAFNQIDFNTYDVGFSARRFFNEDGMLSPFVEFGGGARRMESFDTEFNQKGRNINAVFGSVGVGLELDLTSNLSLFTSVSYEGTYSKELQMVAPVVMFGGVVNF